MTDSPSSPSAREEADRLGVVEIDGDAVRLRYQRHLAHPPDRVWRALTESDQLREWFPADLVGGRHDGAELRLPFWPDVAQVHDLGEEHTLTGRIVTWDPPRVFELDWDVERLRFDLDPGEDGITVLSLTVTYPPRSEPGPEKTAAGYHTCLDALTDLLDDVTRPPFVERDVGPLEDRYRAALRARDEGPSPAGGPS